MADDCAVLPTMPPLSRIHSILGKNVTMHDGAVKQIVAQLEALLDNGLAGAPQLHACVLRDARRAQDALSADSNRLARWRHSGGLGRP